jgi:hypothetical protein
MAKLCDLCGVRPATVRARVTTADGTPDGSDAFPHRMGGSLVAEEGLEPPTRGL